MFKQNKKRIDIIQNAFSVTHRSIRPSCSGGTGGNKVRLILACAALELGSDSFLLSTPVLFSSVCISL